MSTFELLFALFGLLLGFAIAEIAGGFSRAYDRRKTQPIGWLAPGLAAMLSVDLLLFWYGAWFRRDMEVKFWVVLFAAFVGLLYYFAATQVFPREGSSVSPSDHVMAHRKAVVVPVLVANLVMFAPPYVQSVLAGDSILPQGGFWLTLVYLILLVVIGFARPAKVVGAAILLAVLALVGGPLLLNY